MTNLLDRIDRFHRTKKGRLTFGVVEFAVAYLALSAAIDTGSLLLYLVSILLFAGGANNLLRGVIKKRKTNGNKAKNK